MALLKRLCKQMIIDNTTKFTFEYDLIFENAWVQRLDTRVNPHKISQSIGPKNKKGSSRHVVLNKLRN